MPLKSELNSNSITSNILLLIIGKQYIYIYDMMMTEFIYLFMRKFNGSKVKEVKKNKKGFPFPVMIGMAVDGYSL